MVEELLVRIINDLKEGKVDDRVVSYANYDSNYVFPKPKVIVQVEMTNGKTAKIDITDYFKEVVK